MNTFIIAALSADGFIAKNVDQSSISWRSKFDRDFFIAKTREAGVVVMGYNTVKTMRRPMPDRLNIVYSRSDKGLEGFEVTQKPPQELLKDLEARGFSNVAICGGGQIYTMFMKAGVVDKIYLTIEPVLFGSGIRLFADDLDIKLDLISVEKLGESTISLEYDVKKDGKEK